MTIILWLRFCHNNNLGTWKLHHETIFIANNRHVSTSILKSLPSKENSNNIVLFEVLITINISIFLMDIPEIEKQVLLLELVGPSCEKF